MGSATAATAKKRAKRAAKVNLGNMFRMNVSFEKYEAYNPTRAVLPWYTWEVARVRHGMSMIT